MSLKFCHGNASCYLGVDLDACLLQGWCKSHWGEWGCIWSWSCGAAGSKGCAPMPLWCMLTCSFWTSFSSLPQQWQQAAQECRSTRQVGLHSLLLSSRMLGSRSMMKTDPFAWDTNCFGVFA